MSKLNRVISRMDAERKRLIDFFRSILQLDEKQSKVIIKSALTPDQINFIGELALNALAGNISIKDNDIITLDSHKNFIRSLARQKISTKARYALIKKRLKLVFTLLKIVLKEI